MRDHGDVFLSAPPADDVEGPDAVLEGLGHHLQYLVAGVVPVPVVYVLEIIDIDENDAEPPPVPLQFLKPGVQGDLGKLPVGEPREGVKKRQPLELGRAASDVQRCAHGRRYPSIARASSAQGSSASSPCEASTKPRAISSMPAASASGGASPRTESSASVRIRALAATANHFARESHMDELAHRAKMDPLEFRLKNLKNERMKLAFTAAADVFGWKTRKAARGHGFGIGGGVEKGGYVGTCAEVAVDHGEVRVVRVTTAFDCGAVVNPNGLRNQIVGANIMGLGGALFEAIEFKDGRITNGTFTQYRLPRFDDVPEIQPVLIDRKDQPSAGAGETPICGLAPAIGNAIFDATGTRIYSMPMVPNGLNKT